ncbi:MAG: hypothetical protein Q9195_007215 [Heterodermia aff. obscurata]
MSFLTPPQTVASSNSSRDAKRRRIQDSSVERSDLSLSSSSSGGTFVVEKYRVGIPGLRLLPLETSEDPPLATYSKYHEFLPLIREALERRQVQYRKDDVVLCYRTLPGETPSDEDVTILVHASWTREEDGESWYQAADEIRSILLRSWATRAVTVELIDWRLSAPRIMSVVENNHPIIGAWPVVNPLVHEIISEYPNLEEGWRSIDVIRIGLKPGDDPQSAPILPVTISVTVDWSLDRKDWVAAERRIEDLLDHSQLQDVKIEFEHGDVEPQGFPECYPTRTGATYEIHIGDYPELVPMGAPFSAEKYHECLDSKRMVQPGIGTIGGYLESRNSRLCMQEKDVKAGDEPETEEADVPEDSLLRAVDVDGLGPDRSSEAQITYEYPSRRVHNYTLKYIEDKIDDRLEIQAKSHGNTETILEMQEEIDELRAERANKCFFFDEGKHKLGRLWLCTGYKQRSSLNGRVDVALIDMAPDRIGKNLIASESAWKPPFTAPPKRYCGRQLADIASCKAGTDLGRVYKVGARTGATTGRFSKIRSDVKIGWDSKVGMGMSREYCFVPEPASEATFQDSGDSGSFVFTSTRSWPGQTWGGATKAKVGEQKLAYITDAQDIIDWVGGWGGEGELEARLPEEGR